MLCSRLLRRFGKQQGFQRRVERSLNAITASYARSLDFAMRRWMIVACVTAALIGGAGYAD